MAPVFRYDVQDSRGQGGGSRGCFARFGRPDAGRMVAAHRHHYDPRDDAVEIAPDGHDQMIRRPREIYLDDGAAGLTSLEIVDADGVRQIVKLKDQLMLPAPQT